MLFKDIPFIQPMKTEIDVDALKNAYTDILEKTEWPYSNGRYQIQLRNRESDTVTRWYETESQFDESVDVKKLSQMEFVSLAKFTLLDYIHWNKNVPEYIRTLVKEIEEELDCTMGAICLRKQIPATGTPKSTGMIRKVYIPIESNRDNFFIQIPNKFKPNEQIAHNLKKNIPYLVNTLETCFEYNSSLEDTVYLTMSIIPRAYYGKE